MIFLLKFTIFHDFLHSKIDASRFSGTEQFFADSPLLSPLLRNIDFSTPIRSISMPRSIEVLENDRKLVRCGPYATRAPPSLLSSFLLSSSLLLLSPSLSLPGVPWLEDKFESALSTRENLYSRKLSVQDTFCIDFPRLQLVGCGTR